MEQESEVKLKDKTVNIYGLHPMMQIANMQAAVIWNLWGQMLVITSANDGKHGENSFHPKGRACDYRTRYFPEFQIEDIAQNLRDWLGPDYDVVVESDHIHCEFDPQNPKVI